MICPLSYYWGAVAGLLDSGIRVPEDMSVLAFGDRQEAQFYRPRPAILSVMMSDLALKALELVRWREQNPDSPARVLRFQSTWIAGETLAVAKS